MSHIQRRKIGVLPRTRANRQQGVEIMQVQAGLHSGMAPQSLPPGFTPNSRNFVLKEGFIWPRSGLSSTGTFTFSSPVLGAAEVFDSLGNLAGLAQSAVSFAFSHPDSPSWSELSYSASTLNAAALSDVPSGLSTDYWTNTAIYDKNTDKVIAVSSNDTNWMKWFAVEGSSTTFSDFTWVNSLDSMKAAKGLASINDRFVGFNWLSSVGTRFPNRVLWSARGGATDFTLANGAGFEDLVSMRGQGTAAVRFRDFLILFTELEVWRAQPTLDDYAFRFQRISDRLGCPYPRTIVATPLGLIFMSRDFEVYATDGVSFTPLGPVGGSGPSRIQKYLSERMSAPIRSWAMFNQVERRYELYFPDGDSVEGYPNAALFYNLDDQTWWPQKFGIELSIGEELEDPGAVVTWNDITDAWDVTTKGWNYFGALYGVRWPTAFAEDGTIQSFNSNKTNDSGTAIDVRWQSHALRGRDRMRQMNVSEVWIDYENDSNSSASVFLGEPYEAHDYQTGVPVSLTTHGTPAFAPVWYSGKGPVFEFRVGDGGKPRIGAFQANVIDAGKF